MIIDNNYMEGIARISLIIFILYFLLVFLYGFIVRGFYSFKTTVITTLIFLLITLELPTLYETIAQIAQNDVRLGAWLYEYFRPTKFIIVFLLLSTTIAGAAVSSIMPSMKKASRIGKKQPSLLYLFLLWTIIILLYFILKGKIFIELNDAITIDLI